ncbi:MAG TPA: hypothetical protein VFV37_00570 [Luteibaculaceae bacterium]|nr:hypothetical protein [Luteibaculaceae bacterium]
MKKWFSIVWLALLLAYTGGSVGVSIFEHYCGGELKAVSVKPVSCCCDDMAANEMSSDCCKEISVSYTLADQVKTEPLTWVFQSVAAIAPLRFIFHPSVKSTEQVHPVAVVNRPPPEEHRYLKFHSLLFYA